MASTIQPEECFAPEHDSSEEDMTPVTLPKRFCTSSDVSKSELEKIALKRIIEFQYDASDDDDDDDKPNTKLEERIRYLQLDLANAKLEIIELNEKYKPIKDRDDVLNRFEAAMQTIQKNIDVYNDLISRVGSTPTTDLLRQATEKVISLQEVELNSLPIYAQEALRIHYIVRSNLQTRYQDTFNDYIQWEDTKKNIRALMRGAVVLLLSQILGHILFRIVFRP